MELDQDDYILCHFFAVSVDHTFDISGTVGKKHGKGDWKLEYRFRYYASPDPFDKKDKKNWYRASMPGDKPEEEVLKLIREMGEVGVQKGFSEPMTILEVKGDVERFMYLMAQQDYVHIKKMSPEELADKYGINTKEGGSKT